MANRTQSLLHRWLPFVAAGAAAIFLLTLFVFGPYVSSRRNQEREASQAGAKAEDLAVKEAATPPSVLPALVVADARSVLDRAAQATASLDGNPRVVEEIARIVAENDTIRRLWVVNDRGSIVYFGKERPAQPSVEKLAPAVVHRLLQGLPDGLLQPEQRLAILLHAAVRNPQAEQDGSHEFGLPDHGPAHSEIRRIPGGWLAVAAQTPVFHPRHSAERWQYSDSTQRLDRIRDRVIPLSLLVYWLSLPGWVALDAHRRQERALRWGLFALVGNLIGLLVYLLARKED